MSAMHSLGPDIRQVVVSEDSKRATYRLNGVAKFPVVRIAIHIARFGQTNLP